MQRTTGILGALFLIHLFLQTQSSPQACGGCVNHFPPGVNLRLLKMRYAQQQDQSPQLKALQSGKALIEAVGLVSKDASSAST